MKKLNFISNEDYETILNRFKSDLIKEKERGTKGGGGVPSDKRTLSEVGNKFISLVANNFDKEFITYTDALNYLSIKSKNFDKVLAQAKNCEVRLPRGIPRGRSPPPPPISVQ